MRDEGVETNVEVNGSWKEILAECAAAVEGIFVSINDMGPLEKAIFLVLLGEILKEQMSEPLKEEKKGDGYA